eukprot:14001214-Ditylum_brightwellii.AAC.1
MKVWKCPHLTCQECQWSMVKEKSGRESKDNVEVWSNDNLASSFPEPNEQGNMMEVEIDVDVPE